MTNVFNDPFNFSIVPSRLQRTVLENHTVGSFMNLTPCLQCPLRHSSSTIWLGWSVSWMTYMLYSRISNQGGSLSSLHCELLSPTCYCCISMPASARANLSAKSCLALSCTSPWHSFTSFCFQKRGGERTGEDDLASDTSLVHSQLQVRGGVSLGQYHSTG